MVIINDTNIWIDLKFTNLIDQIFLLPYKIAVPNILYNDELKDVDGPTLERNGIEILEMTDDEVMETAQRSSKTKRVSFNDLTTLVVAKTRGYTLVTGDGNLRRIAQKESVSLRGTIWLIDELITNHIISYTEGISACQALIDYQRRLPKDELEKRIQLWNDEAAAD